MALTRKLLRGMGLTDEQVDTIIEAHVDATDGLKSETEKYKADAEKLPGVQRELDDLKKTIGDGGEAVSKADYDRLQKEFTDYKSDIAAKDAKAAKETAYRKLLEGAGIDPKRINAILKITDIDSIELAEDGKIKDADTRTESVKAEFADFVITRKEGGANVANPPKNDGGGNSVTKEQIMAIKDGSARRQAMAKNPELFGITLDD